MESWAEFGPNRAASTVSSGYCALAYYGLAKILALLLRSPAVLQNGPRWHNRDAMLRGGYKKADGGISTAPLRETTNNK